ncbi:hypothetical protein J2855_001964 [Agrobacterium tumefaciens]|uniref:hypothetical protein n=1 Tax=Agrobacterium tumefaciens TaxID=358 RepID=UPI000DD01643|nr:hypothetical protein [Agrobacterium tumefaciens]MBP2508329.1 hypothetical protein [Agrobacterium tumefaciens]MBP2517481.1 hypothetical protein [Agrobacterium tumefaciens]MBP2576115.1 hypothetical protein [Agrobacterium tumefaciens]MBP2594471.1 hypothetical protein [Agrobacterium tumefaciens]
MNYEKYLFVEKLFIFRHIQDQASIDEAISSHQRLISIAEKAYPPPRDFFVKNIVDAAKRIIENLNNTEKKGTLFYKGLSKEQLDELSSKNSRDFFSYIYPILAGYHIKFRDTENSQDPDVLNEIISLISWETLSSGPESIHSIIQPKLEIFEKEATRRAEELADTVSEHRKLFDDQKLLHAQASEATAKAHIELTTAGHTFEQKALELEDRSKTIDDNIRQLRADLDAQVARFGTEAARKLWGEREKQSRIALIASSIAIFLMIAAPIGLAICFTSEVLHYLAQIVAASALPTTDATGQLPTPSDAQVTIAAIGRLVIVTVPIFLYIWAIRLVVRFNSRSLMLLDDARLRLTMLDTFFHLIEKEGAVKEDRALVLNALFRPAPGHGDNVDPPNFTELVTKAMGAGPGK